MRIIAAIVALAWVGNISGPALAEEEIQTRIFRIDYQTAAELEPSAASQLSPAGKITVHQSSNSLIVVDTPEALRRVQKALEELDRKPANIRIEISFVEKSRWSNLNLKISWRFIGKGWMIGSIPPPAGGTALGLEALLSSGESVSVKKQTILVMENRPGRIFAGSEHPYTDRTVHVTRGHIYAEENTRFKEAGESLYVAAARAGEKRLKIAVEPESSRMDPLTGSIDVHRLSTAVVIDDPGSLVLARQDEESGGSSANIPSGAAKADAVQSRVIILSARSEP